MGLQLLLASAIVEGRLIDVDGVALHVGVTGEGPGHLDRPGALVGE
jgi:hypothetical protein